MQKKKKPRSRSTDGLSSYTGMRREADDSDGEPEPESGAGGDQGGRGGAGPSSWRTSTRNHPSPSEAGTTASQSQSRRSSAGSRQRTLGGVVEDEEKDAGGQGEREEHTPHPQVAPPKSPRVVSPTSPPQLESKSHDSPSLNGSPRSHRSSLTDRTKLVTPTSPVLYASPDGTGFDRVDDGSKHRLGGSLGGQDAGGVEAKEQSKGRSSDPTCDLNAPFPELDREIERLEVLRGIEPPPFSVPDWLKAVQVRLMTKGEMDRLVTAASWESRVRTNGFFTLDRL